jgi:transposase
MDLETIVARGADWRQRLRAQTLLLLDSGLSTKDTSVALGIHAQTIHSTRNSWFKAGVNSLVDMVRIGAPRKITPEQVDKIVVWAIAEPLSAKQLLAKHLEHGGAVVTVKTLATALKAAGLVWKRTRHSLTSRRDEAAFRSAQAQIEELRDQAATGQIVLAYVDEAGFSQVHPNRSAWTEKGKRHLIEAKRGKRLNVLAALLSNGELFSAKLWQSTTSAAFSGFLGLLVEHVGKPLTVILDNASIHKAKSERKLMKYLEGKGITFYFLPPYSPELNRIERLWHMMKYTWMAAKCRDSNQLEADIDDMTSNFGTKYKFSF